MSNDLVKKIELLVRPIVTELNYDLYYIEYVKENGNFYLRIYIDKEDDRISLNDCEIVSRGISDVLDAQDPIKDAYYLEVSSPGVNKNLHTDEHFKKVIGNEVLIKLTSSINGTKTIKGTLVDINEENIIVKNGEEEISIPKEKIKNANLEGEL